MDLTHSIVRFRRHLKRRNLSPHTIRSYLSNLKQFIVWVDTPIEEVTYLKIGAYIDLLLTRRLAPKTINCHLVTIRRASSVARSKSFSAPALNSSNTNFSAARPPNKNAIRPSSSLSVIFSLSSSGSVCVTPSARPRGMTVTLCTRSAPLVSQANSA